MRTVPDILSDPAVPGLAVALQADALLELLSERLPECRDGVRFIDGRAVDVQYTPGMGAQVLWKIRLYDPETGRTGRQLIFIRALRNGEAMPAEPGDLVSKYRDLRSSKGMARVMPLRTPWLMAGDAQLIVHAFPLDPDLPSLMTLASPDAMKVALQRVWQARGVRVRRVRVETLSYTSGARAAMHYEVLAEDSKSHIPELRRLVGKVDVRRSPARLFASHWAVWRKGFGRVSVAPPVGYVAVAGLSLQEFLAGTRLSDLAGQGEFVGRVRRAARAIAVVHSLNLPVLKHRSVEKEMSGVDRWASVLAGLRPAQSRRLEALSRRLRGELSDRMRITATVHADFHLANVMADKHGVTLIDWDQAAHGDPMLDVGRFLASLRVSSLRLNGRLDGLASAEDGFLEAYLEQTGDDEQRARLFEAASLLTAAAAPFRLQREGWEEYADLMIDEVERVLELSLTGIRFPGTHADFKREVPFEERTAWATDRAYTQALLVPLVHDAYGADIELTECIPAVKASSGSRIRVRWTVKGYRGDERWSRIVEGIGFPETSGRNILHRLELIHAAASRDAATLQIARPLGLIGPLSLVVREPPMGRRLDKLLDADRDLALLDKLAVAIARFQSLDIRLSKERETMRIAKSVARSVRALERSGHPDAMTASGLVSAVVPLIGALRKRQAVTVFPLTLRQLWVTDDGIVASPVHDVLMADPLVNAGSMLAGLTVAALQRGTPQSAAERFRCGYLDASGESARDLAAWQVLLLLRLASARGVHEPASPLTRLIIHAARQLLEGMNEPDPSRVLVASFSIEPGSRNS